MSDTALATTDALTPAILESALLGGDLERMSAKDRITFMMKVCESLGLNPLTQPFAFIKLNGKLTMYARKDATEQLRNIHAVSIKITGREVVEGVYVVTAQATNGNGRCDESIGAVPIDGLKGEARSNAMMKAETKAKRRVTLSISGLGMLDETEVDSVPGAQRVEASAEYTPPKPGPFAQAKLSASKMTSAQLEAVVKESHGQDRAEAAGTIAPKDVSVESQPSSVADAKTAAGNGDPAVDAAVAKVTEIFPGASIVDTGEAADKADLDALEAIIKELQLKKKYVQNWIEKYFGRTPESFSKQQAKDATWLWEGFRQDKAAGEEAAKKMAVYRARIAQLQKAGRINP